MPPILRNIVLAASFIAFVMAAARGVAALPAAMRGAGSGPLQTAEEVFLRSIDGDL